jgi:hypothetical protein
MLKKLSLMVSTLGLLALVLAPQGWSQQQAPAAAGLEQGDGRAARMYNPQAVETLAGKVEAVNRRAPKRPGWPALVILDLQTGQGTVKVLMGPADYIDQQALKLAAGDQVEVKGMRVTRPKVNLFIAGAVKKGDQILQLRDDTTGRPLWAKGKKPTVS